MSPITAAPVTRLAGAGLADHAEHLAPGDVEGDAVDARAACRGG